MKRAGCLETTLLGRRVEVEVWEEDGDEGPCSFGATGEVVGVWLEREPGSPVSTPTLLVAFDDSTLHCTRLDEVTRILPRPDDRCADCPDREENREEGWVDRELLEPDEEKRG